MIAPFLLAGSLAGPLACSGPAAPPVSRFHRTAASETFQFETHARVVQRDRSVELVVLNKWTGARTVLSIDPTAIALQLGSGRMDPVSVDALNPYEIVVAGRASVSGEGVLVRVVLEMEPLADRLPSIAEVEVLYQGTSFADLIAMTHRTGTSSLFLIDRASWSVVGFFLLAAAPYPIADGAAHPELAGLEALAVTPYFVSGEDRPRGLQLRASKRPWSSRRPDLSKGQRTVFLTDTDRDGIVDRIR